MILKMKTTGKVATYLRSLGRVVDATGETVEKYLRNSNNHIRSYAVIASTGIAATSNDAKIQCDHFQPVNEPFQYRPAASYGHFLDQTDAKALLQPFCLEN